MRIHRDNFLIEFDDAVERSRIMSSDGKPLAIDLDFNPKEHRKQVGVIVALPVSMSPQYNSTLELGDKVLVSHQVAEQERFVRDNIYRSEYFNIFAKINKELEPIEDFIFCDKVFYGQEGVLEQKKEYSTKVAQVRAVSKRAKEEGIQVGDLVHFTHNADYEIIVGSNKYVRMRVRNVIAIERGGLLHRLKSKVMIRQLIEKKFIAGIEVIPEKTPQKKGVVMFGNYAGKEVCYFEGHSSHLQWNGNNYSFINEENIKFIYES